MTGELTLETEIASVRAALAQAVAEKGDDYVYKTPAVLVYDDRDEWRKVDADTCVYVEPVFDADDTVVGRRPSCLWGHVMVTLGVDPVDLEAVNEEGIDSIMMPAPWGSEVISWAARASQLAQDAGERWDEAVFVFEEHLKMVLGEEYPAVPGTPSDGGEG